MKVVYLAGPYRSETEYGVHQNIQNAEPIALEIWRLGAVCICPQKNTAYFGGVLPDNIWLEGDKELIRRSDALFMLNGWENSKGATSEKTFAEKLDIPVFEDIKAIRDWICQSI